jgi:hypothetical protein
MFGWFTTLRPCIGMPMVGSPHYDRISVCQPRIREQIFPMQTLLTIGPTRG